MTVIFAVEAWILAILGWGWLAAQEVFGKSLLAAHVFIGMLLISTCNLVLTAISPKSSASRSAFFAAVLVLFLHAACCVGDTLLTPQMGAVAFESPTKNPACTLAKSQQLFHFSSSSLFVVQAGATLGYLIVQLIVAGAGMLDASDHTLWPGAAWGLGLGMMLCFRLFVMFDGTAKGLADRRTSYVQLFSLPVVEVASVFAVFMFTLGIFLGIEGMIFAGVTWRKSVRYVAFVFSMLSVGFTMFIMFSRGLMTPSLVILLVIIIAVNVIGLISAVLVLPPMPSRQEFIAPSAPPASSVFARPTQRWQDINPGPTAPPADSMYGVRTYGRAMQSSRPRFFIPAPVEMMGLAVEKNKGV